MKDLVIASLIMLTLDAIYLRLTKGFFGNVVKAIQNAPLKLRYGATAGVYIFLIIGLYLFVLQEKKNWRQAFILGLVIYGVFDLTTYAIFDEWPIAAVFMDTLWGGFLLAATTFLTEKVVAHL